MVKKLANKQTKELLTEAEIKEKNLPKEAFTQSWQGRLFVADPEHSEIAEKVGVGKKGEFAIKI